MTVAPVRLTCSLRNARKALELTPADQKRVRMLLVLDAASGKLAYPFLNLWGKYPRAGLRFLASWRNSWSRSRAKTAPSECAPT